ncbi:hypothetical protein CH352_03695 [Leptospira hartskeerlii]|uniref:Uncharacterized protein n=1 Tax=Leptospira hartskeerlii TaxID=2023177 RepID=A0A2M9XGI7_9LEPT|nr:hypothetical protein [Leptospira hartskeerlii]PJZ26801.1 hypothetical protein CH357_04760 [Leptospira hartskeerlii]PJZ34717.1 hypothetical protein CH352_03695 [Leptospira hartskeerlii]
MKPNRILRPWIYGIFLILTAFLSFWVGRLGLENMEISFSDIGSETESVTEFNYFARPRLILKNVRFYWQKDIFVEADRLSLEAIAKNGEILPFDRPELFTLKILNGNIHISFESLEKLINGRLFSFPGSTLRKIKLRPIFHNGAWKLKIAGEVKFVVWVSFEGIATVKIDQESGRILLENESVRALLNPYTKELLNTVGVSIEDLVRFPKGKGLVFIGNKVFFEPFSVFPDPEVEGKIKDLKLDENALDIEFIAEQDIPSPKTNSKNYIYVTGGKLLFGGIQVHQGKVLLLDRDESSQFEFCFSEFKKALSLSNVKMEEDGRILIFMPDSPPLN